jgi:hypothetical protein
MSANAAVAAPVGVDDEVTSTINIHRIGAFYYDEALHPYTVADEYIITKDDLPVFDVIFGGLVVPQPPASDVSANNLLYICNRYLLLLLDIAWNDLDGMSQEAAEGGESIDGVVDSEEKSLVKDPGIFESGTPTRTRINQLIDMVTRVEETLDAAAARDAINFVKGSVELYSIPPTGDETRTVDGLSAIQSRILTCRNQLLANIDTYADAERGTEYGQTVEVEQATATNYSRVEEIGKVTYTRYVEPIAQEVLGKLWLLKEDGSTASAPGLGDVIYSTIVNTVAHVAGAAQQDVIDEKYVIGSFPKDFVDDMVTAIEEWGLATAPPQNDTQWRRFDGMLYAVRSRIDFIRNAEKRALLAAATAAAASAPPGAAAGQGAPLAAVAPAWQGREVAVTEMRGSSDGFKGGFPSLSNASGSSSGGVRRRLYEGLRKRGGTGTPPSV